MADESPFPHASHEATETEPDESRVPADLAQDTLVEEVSIDGMCGVY